MGPMAQNPQRQIQAQADLEAARAYWEAARAKMEKRDEASRVLDLKATALLSVSIATAAAFATGLGFIRGGDGVPSLGWASMAMATVGALAMVGAILLALVALWPRHFIYLPALDEMRQRLWVEKGGGAWWHAADLFVEAEENNRPIVTSKAKHVNGMAIALAVQALALTAAFLLAASGL